MNINMLNENEIGYNVTIITVSGNKLQGTIIKTIESDNAIKLKTNDGIIIVNCDAIESIY